MPALDVIDSIDIKAAPSTVFDVVADYSSISQWFPVYRCNILQGDKIRIGSQIEHLYGHKPFVISRFIRRIDRIVPGNRLEESYIDGNLRGTGIWSFENHNGSTLVSFHCKVRSNSFLSHLGFTLLGDRAHSDVYKPLLQALKNRCEK